MVFKSIDNFKKYLGKKIFMNGTLKLFFSQFPRYAYGKSNQHIQLQI